MQSYHFIWLSLIGLIFSALATACGGGSTDAATTYPARIALPDVELNPSVESVVIAALPDGFHADTVIQLTLRSNGYFTQNPDAHAPLVTRQDLALNGKAIRGQGMLFGNVSQAPGGNPIHPSLQAETWCNGIGDGSFLLNGQSTPPVLSDGVDYQVTLHTHVGTDRSDQFIRFQIRGADGVSYESGEIHDPNTAFDATKNGIWIGHVFQNPLAAPWTLKVYGITVTLS
ncbi:hypothetical protein [Curvibacter gracilis]|uniref:hypothetical protein n=1 Tax=Curvibacter gracilis TaxID=230310 RepID=UPI00048327B2|nr:hypothetical protein [Curvibacter gracilis]